MQIEQLLEKMSSLKLYGMATALRTQMQQKDIGQLSFDDRLGLLLEHEILHKEDKRLTSLLKKAKLRESANIESIEYKASRKLNRSKILSLSTGLFIKNNHNLYHSIYPILFLPFLSIPYVSLFHNSSPEEYYHQI